MMNLKSEHRAYPPGEAEAAAAYLTRNDADGWTYRAKHDLGDITRWAVVEVFDEAGEYLGLF